MPHPALGKSFLAAASALLALPSLNAGIMDPAIGVQTYRDFAENRGIFAADATNVQIYNTSGVYVGTIERMMNFDSVVDGGWSSLAGGPSFIATVAHNNSTNVSFTGRFGATGVFADSYHFVAYNRGWGAETNYTYDYATPRLNKIVTEAQATPYLTDTSILNNIVGRTVFRVGGGTQTLATGYGSETGVTGAYAYLTGGTIGVTLEQCRIPSGTIPADANGTDYQSQTINPTHPASYYNSYSFFAPNRPSDADQPLDIGIRAGDSGSSSWTYNNNTGRWEYLAAGQSGGGAGFNATNQYRSGNAYAQSVIDAYNSPTVTPTAAGGEIVWNAPDATGAGTLTQGESSWAYIGLNDTVRGATSTLAANGVSTTVASDAAMNATRNLIFAGDGGTIRVASPLDMGAGSVTFLADYTLTGARLNTAGFIIAGGRTVTTQLTGIAGDEWRVVSDI